MGDSAVDYCLKQTRMETMFCTAPYLKKILGMREQGMATQIKNVVMFDTDAETVALTTRATAEFQIRVFTLDAVREAGRQNSAMVLKEDAVTRDDVYMLNYTSGTTGDSKGVKVTQWGILSSAIIFYES
jgi:long-chain acyl-CoA synthetase